MGTSPLSRAQFVSRPVLRGVVARLGLPPRQTSAVFRYVLPAEPSGARIDAPVGQSERSRLELEGCRAGMQHWGRSLFNPVGHPLGATGLKSAPGCGRYFEGNTELRRERNLHSRWFPVGRCFDF